MKNIKLILSASILVLSSCSGSKSIPISKAAAANNSSYEVEYLFEHEGCKVYRFLDAGNYVYFTNCQGTVTSIENDSTHTRIVNQIDVLPANK